MSDVRVDTDEQAARIDASTVVPFSPEVVWNELLDPVAIEQWWGHPAVFPKGFVPGSVGTFAWEGQTFPLHIDVVEPEHTWQFRWGELGEADVTEKSATVTFTLEQAEGGTLLSVSEQFPGEIAPGNVEGWRIVLTSFAAYLHGEAD